MFKELERIGKKEVVMSKIMKKKDDATR